MNLYNELTPQERAKAHAHLFDHVSADQRAQILSVVDPVEVLTYCAADLERRCGREEAKMILLREPLPDIDWRTGLARKPDASAVTLGESDLRAAELMGISPQQLLTQRQLELSEREEARAVEAKEAEALAEPGEVVVKLSKADENLIAREGLDRESFIRIRRNELEHARRLARGY